MPQRCHPLSPLGATAITPAISFVRTDTTISYFQYDMPMSSHHIDDRAAFKLTMAQPKIYCDVKQAVLSPLFAIPPITIKRSVKCYKTLSVAGFFTTPARRGAVVLTQTVLAQAQQLLNANNPPACVTSQLNLKVDTLRKAIVAGKLQYNAKKSRPHPK